MKTMKTTAALFFSAIALFHLCLLMAPSAHARGGKPPIEGVINLNTATLEQLTLLPRIGRKKAQRVLDYRKKNTQFKNPQEITRVKGIGYKTFLRLKPHLTTTQKTNVRLREKR
ncbi:helix-hairpin-helix domain-containing protein [Myxococcota bacterium]|nr:helix-hairpin-helix domain-containing protein [Myxococcota bacterium]